MDDDLPVIKVEIVEDTVITDLSPPCGRLSLKALQISVEGVRFNRDQYRFDPCLILTR